MNSRLLMLLLALSTACKPDPLQPVPTVAPSTCANPGLRVDLGPMSTLDSGDWAQQPQHDHLSRRYAGQSAAVADFDGDGRLDIFLPYDGQDRLYINVGDGDFVDETDGRLPRATARTSTVATAVDIDADGDLDLYVGTLTGPDALLINDGDGNFTEGADAFGLGDNQRPTLGAAFADMDGDGDLDLLLHYLGVWQPDWILDGPEADFPVTDLGTLEALFGDQPLRILFENRGGVFVDVSERLPREPMLRGLSYAAGWLDLDGSGSPDLLFVNDYREEFLPWTNLALRNDGSGRFTDASTDLGLGQRVCGMGLGAGDLNGDQAPDLLVSSWDDLVLLESTAGGPYVETQAAHGLAPDPDAPQQVAWGAQLGDMDNDGDTDAVVGFGFLPPDLSFQDSKAVEDQVDGLFLRGADGRYQDEAAAWGVDFDGVTRGVIVADLNDDGWLDILHRDLAGPARLHLSRCGDASWLKIHLVDRGPNPFGIGARVELELGQKRHVGWMMAGGTGTGGSGPPELHFGLGDAREVDRITVTWPDGHQSVETAVAAGQTLELEADAGR